MDKEKIWYSLQLRPVGKCSESLEVPFELEVMALPTGAGETIRGRFRHWEPVFDRICSVVSSSPFHRKVMHRTLLAGLPTNLIDRSTGGKHLFSPEEIAKLELAGAGELDPAA